MAELVTDPVCGMKIDPSFAKGGSLVHGGPGTCPKCGMALEPEAPAMAFSSVSVIGNALRLRSVRL